jgi:hypothetical protein
METWPKNRPFQSSMSLSQTNRKKTVAFAHNTDNRPAQPEIICPENFHPTFCSLITRFDYPDLNGFL